MRLQPRDAFQVQDDIEILASLDVVRHVNNGVTIAATKVPADASGNKIIKKGMPLAKITAAGNDQGKYRPYTGNVVAENITKTTDDSAVLYDAPLYVAGDVVTFSDGANTEQKTVASVDLETKTVTFTAAFSNDFAKDATVCYTSDGGYDPTVLLNRQVNVKDGDHIVGGYEVAKVIGVRIPVTVTDTLRQKMPHIVFA